MYFLNRGLPCLTWPAQRSTSYLRNWASTRRLNLRRRCQRSTASLLPKTARSKTIQHTSPPLPLLPLRTPPQIPTLKSSTLTYNLSEDKSRNLTVTLCSIAVPRPAGNCRNACNFTAEPADHGSVFGEGQNHSISKRPFKVHSLNLHIFFLLLVLFFSAHIPVGWFVCAFLRLEVCVRFVTSRVSCFEDSCLTWALVCLIASYPLWNWMKPQAKIIWQAWGWCYMFLWVGLMYTRWFNAGLSKKKIIKYFKKMNFSPGSCSMELCWRLCPHCEDMQF